MEQAGKNDALILRQARGCWLQGPANEPICARSGSPSAQYAIEAGRNIRDIQRLLVTRARRRGHG
jgi:hypothetical protein